MVNQKLRLVLDPRKSVVLMRLPLGQFDVAVQSAIFRRWLFRRLSVLVASQWCRVSALFRQCFGWYRGGVPVPSGVVLVAVPGGRGVPTVSQVVARWCSAIGVCRWDN